MNRNIKVLLSLYRVFSRAYFHLPFMVIYLYKIGFNLIFIEVIMAVYGIAVFVYTKATSNIKLSFYIPCKHMLLLSEILKCVGLLILVVSNNFIGICVAQIILGLGYGVGAGYDTQIINYYFDDGGKFQSHSNSLMFISLLIAGLLGSVLFDINICLPFIASVFASILTSVVCIILPNKPEKVDTPDKKEIREKVTYQEKILICVYCFTRGIILTFFTGFLPYHLFVDLNIPVYGFIAILTSYTFFGNISSNFIAGKLKGKYAVKIMNICLVISLSMYFSGNLIMIVIATILLGLTSGTTRPICLNELRNNGSDLAFMSSMMESIYSVINIVLLVLGGILYYFGGFICMHMLFAFVFMIYIILYFIFWKRSQDYEKQS